VRQARCPNEQAHRAQRPNRFTTASALACAFWSDGGGSTAERFHNGTRRSAMKRIRRVDRSIWRLCAHARHWSFLCISPSQVTTMGWLDLDEYRQIESAARDRLGDLLRAAGPERRRAAAPLSALSTILYVSAALRAKPREIDRYIDYFGDRVPHQR